MKNLKKKHAVRMSSILEFWEERAKRYKGQEVTNLSNLEADEELAQIKHREERKVLMDFLHPEPGQEILDLGAGHCAWSTELARITKHVDAVEFSEGMINLARRRINNKKIKNITLHHVAAQDFNSTRLYDTALLSGLLIYLNDGELANLLQKIKGYMRSGGRVILRDGTGKKSPFTITNHYSEELDANYSAHYRTAAQYIEWFARYEFDVIRHQNMFPDGSPLNKRKETILRVYEFKKAGK